LSKRIISINNAAWLISSGSGIVVLAISILFYLKDSGITIYLLAGIPVSSIIIIFFAARYIMNRYILEKLKPVYRSPNDNALRETPKHDNSTSNNISEAEGEVNDQVERNKKEVEKLKNLENYRKEFLGNVYHELKTPIFNMQGYILTLLEGGIRDKSINRLYLERAEKNINRMISIVEDLETISRLESGVMNLNIEIFNIRKTIEEVFEANEIRAEVNNIEFDIKPSKRDPVLVKGDRKRIYQVLNNLVINSINYGDRNGKTTITLSSKSDKIIIEVKDNGIGINKSDIKRVFERFYRVDKSRSRNTGGTGLGLSIVKHIVEAHNQKIKIGSKPGEGTKFTFTMEKG